MRFTSLALLLLAGCGSSGEDAKSDSSIANRAVMLETQADANVNRMIAEIESTEPVAAAAKAEAKTGIENAASADQ